MRSMLVLLFFGSFLASASAQRTLVEHSTAITLQTKQNFLVYKPKDYDAKEKVPLVLFLHGAGERGDGDFDLLKIHGLPKLIQKGKEFSFLVVAPQCRKDVWWQPTELSALLDHIEANYKVDKDRIYVTGLSMGGFGTWGLALRESKRFAAIAPICGGGNVVAAGYDKSITVPTWAFHGAKDPVVPLSASEAMINVLKKNNVEAKLTVYPEAGHDSWTETYENEELYKWLLSHTRQK